LIFLRKDVRHREERIYPPSKTPDPRPGALFCPSSCPHLLPYWSQLPLPTETHGAWGPAVFKRAFLGNHKSAAKYQPSAQSVPPARISSVFRAWDPRSSVLTNKYHRRRLFGARRRPPSSVSSRTFTAGGSKFGARRFRLQGPQLHGRGKPCWTFAPPRYRMARTEVCSPVSSQHRAMVISGVLRSNHEESSASIPRDKGVPAKSGRGSPLRTTLREIVSGAWGR